MSAFVVDSAHIDVLVYSLIHHKVIGPEAARAAGTLLWQENTASVNHRYREQESTEDYTPQVPAGTLHPIAVLKAAECYAYQSCEHPGWQSSDAHTLIQLLRMAIFEQTPEMAVSVPNQRRDQAYKNTPAYEAAPWSVSDADDATADRLAIKMAGR